MSAPKPNYAERYLVRAARRQANPMIGLIADTITATGRKVSAEDALQKAEAIANALYEADYIIWGPAKQ